MNCELRILHCVTDEKFIDDLIEFTQVMWTGCYHEYAFIYSHPDIEFKYIHKKEFVKRFRGHQIVDYIQKEKINVVILHNLYSIPVYDLASIPPKVTVVWFAWGFDLYSPTYQIHRPLIKIDMYYEKTKQALNNVKSLNYKFELFISAVLRCKDFFKIKKAIYRVDFFSGVIPEEYDLIIANKKNHYFRAKPLHFNYHSSQNGFKEEYLNQPTVSGFDIQIGNSGDPTNNHIDVMSMLQQYKIKDKRIICPLSYSGPKYYRDIVKKYGENAFGERFHPLISFIPYDEYTKILSTTRYAIFAMERQQAMGNVLSGLWEGRMLFLSENNPEYLSLKKRGYVLFTIQKDLSMIERNEMLSEKDIMTNRRLLISDFLYFIERKKTHVIITRLKESLEN